MDFAQWLRDHHDRRTTPREELEAAVHRATGDRLHSARRLVVGQMNEVYDIALDSGRQLILRLSHDHDERWFEGERWALDAARAVGVPTPRVLNVERLDDVHICVEEKLPGTTLQALLAAGERPRRAIDQLGSLLARIHRVPVDGFGYLQADGRGWPVTLADIMVDLLDQREAVMASGRHWSIPGADVDRGLALLAGHRDLYAWDTPVLLHGDFGPGNILVEGDRISGVIDMQDAMGGHPLFELTVWHLHVSDRVPLAELLRSYDSDIVRDPLGNPLFQLLLIRQCLWMLMVRAEQDHPYDVDAFRNCLGNALRFFAA